MCARFNELPQVTKQGWDEISGSGTNDADRLRRRLCDPAGYCLRVGVKCVIDEPWRSGWDWARQATILSDHGYRN